MSNTVPAALRRTEDDILQIRVHGQAGQATLIYLPGLHGDWTLIHSFRAQAVNRFRFIEFTYPRTRTWSLDDYAREILRVLKVNNIGSGWIIGESFGSQVMWTLAQQCCAPQPAQSESSAGSNTVTRSFVPQGLILAGGFVRHPEPLGVWFAYQFFRLTPPVGQYLVRFACRLYGWIRHWNSPENQQHMHEFLERRTAKDWAAATHRLRLITQNDPRNIARQITLPVFHLAGFIDPIVPGSWIRRWLRMHCPGFRESKIFYAADHNVLGTAPRASAHWISQWIHGEP